MHLAFLTSYQNIVGSSSFVASSSDTPSTSAVKFEFHAGLVGYFYSIVALLLLPPYVVRVRLSSPTQMETSVETDRRAVPSCGSQRTLSAEGEKSSPLPCPLFASEFTFSINHAVPTGATQGIPYLIQHTHVHTHAQWSSVSVADCLSPRRSSGDCN